MEQNIKAVGIVGAGLMGASIGVEFARFGYPVRLYDINEAGREQALERVREDLDLLVYTELINIEEAEAAYGRLRFTSDLEDAVAEADYVVEAVTEHLPVKQEVFSRLDALCPPATILATNTSQLLVTDIASDTKHPERILATHYFYPPIFVPLVEVVGGEKTDRKVVERAAAILCSMRKKAVIIDIELPHFVGNRLQIALYGEIRSLVDRGVCTPEKLDDIISFGFGRRLAYSAFFKRIDQIGLDFECGVEKERGEEPWSEIVERVQRGELGTKSGKGFYDWSGDKPGQFRRWMFGELARLLKQDMEEGRI